VDEVSSLRVPFEPGGTSSPFVCLALFFPTSGWRHSVTLAYTQVFWTLKYKYKRTTGANIMKQDELLYIAQVSRLLKVYHYRVLGLMQLYGKRPQVINGRYYFKQSDVEEVYELRRLDELEQACIVIRRLQKQSPASLSSAE
jgi:hypothetical protein